MIECGTIYSERLSQFKEYQGLSDKYPLVFFGVVREAEIQLQHDFTVDELFRLWKVWIDSDSLSLDDVVGDFVRWYDDG